MSVNDCPQFGKGAGCRGMRRLCVFCASSTGANPAFARAAEGVGTLLGQRGIGLVYGGGNVGLMGVVADAARAAGGEVIGVIPRALVARELAHRGVTRLEEVDTMHERKQRMHDLSDGFVALPGGFGTMDELFEALTWTQLGMHEKPCAILDVDGYYAPLLAFLDGATSAQLVRPEHRAMLLSDTDPARLLDRMAAYRAPSVQKWIEREDV
jgi:uncharacterized protein (TIGR00730 family)